MRLIAADGAAGQGEGGVVEDPTALTTAAGEIRACVGGVAALRRVAADAAVREGEGAAVEDATALTTEAGATRVRSWVNQAAGDRQSRERCRDAAIDLEHPTQVVAADRHARRRAGDRRRPDRMAQLKLAAAQRDRLRTG